MSSTFFKFLKKVFGSSCRPPALPPFVPARSGGSSTQRSAQVAVAGSHLYPAQQDSVRSWGSSALESYTVNLRPPAQVQLPSPYEQSIPHSGTEVKRFFADFSKNFSPRPDPEQKTARPSPGRAAKKKEPFGSLVDLVGRVAFCRLFISPVGSPY